MSDNDPREYDREFTTHAGPQVRRRLGRDIERSEVTRFVVQLEYLVNPATDEWVPTVRSDHDIKGSDEAIHDIAEEGVHIDLYGARNDRHIAVHRPSTGE